MAKIFLSLVLCVCLTACGEQKIVNNIRLVHTIGYDMAGANIKGTVLMGDYKKQGEDDILLLDTVSNSEFDLMPRLNTKTEDPIEYGQLGVVLFGKKFSKRGVALIMKNLCGDPNISSRMHLAVADMDATELLEITRQSKNSYFLSDLIEQNVKKGNLPRNNLQISLFNFYGKGRDMYLPHLSQERGNVKIDGLALFRKDKYITKINIRDALLLKLLIENAKNGSFLVPLGESKDPQNDFILLKFLDTNVKFKLEKREPTPSISLHLKMDTQIKYVPNKMSLQSNEEISIFEKRMAAYFEQEIQRLISFAKNNNVDPIGLGDFVRSKSEKWSSSDFQEKYSKLETHVDVEFKVIQSAYIH
ncbi:Ger(x)C family spore germination protein [Paenibacillus psychroresistens]|uniref:Ger(x)C family spore germination protein n=1 Tax=Paenibacillus psychroresistens TaxID=1778678 RepID=UPI001391A55B|nr:Ger(x)C family spore germination protein [Paenibacillus psychroresistens]